MVELRRTNIPLSPVGWPLNDEQFKRSIYKAIFERLNVSIQRETYALEAARLDAWGTVLGHPRLDNGAEVNSVYTLRLKNIAAAGAL